MKKLKLVLVIGIIALICFGCANKTIKLDVNDADRAEILNGFNSSILFDVNTDMVKDLAKEFTDLSFEPTKSEIDYASAFLIYFYKGNDGIAKVKVDKNGVLCLNGESGCYKATSGSFDYEHVKDIYLKSKDNLKR